MKKKHDFGGYATKNGLKCSDGRTIIKDAFKHQNGITIPLVWQHLHNEPSNILGHAVLENREDGVYAYGYFNDTPQGINTKQLVEHGDITSLSIFANDLKQRGQDVLHGMIRELSLVLSGANPGAMIDYLSLTHSDDDEIDEDGALIFTGLTLQHDSTGAVADVVTPEVTPPAAVTDGETIQDVLDSMSEKQRNVVIGLLAEVVGSEDVGDTTDTGAAAATDDNSAAQSDDKGENFMKKNVFDKTDDKSVDQKTLTHAQVLEIVADAQKCGSLKDAFAHAAVTYGIENIDYLFPDARTIADSPDFVSRRMEWVTSVINGAKHSPFSRIKSMSADLTYDTARAKGYIKGNLKTDEFFGLAFRTTTPTTIYKKQKLDRDDIIDITDLDVVAWLKAEMRVMLDEELGRAALIGDGRPVLVNGSPNPDKIDETHIRPIAKDDTFYAHQVYVTANTSGETLIEAVLRNRTYYKGSGTPTMFTTEAILTDLLLVKDKMGRRLYPTSAELASAMRVSSIVPVEVMEGVAGDQGDLICILVNMTDYTFGADKGGAVGMFDDFDIDYNQYKYLIETRLSGCLTKPKSAMVFWRASGTLVPTITAPTIVTGTNVITIPSTTGIQYMIDGVNVSAGAQSAITEDVTVSADPKTGYYFNPGVTDSWDFAYTDNS